MRLRARAARPDEARREVDSRLLRALPAAEARAAAHLDGRLARRRPGLRGDAGPLRPRRPLAAGLEAARSRARRPAGDRRQRAARVRRLLAPVSQLRRAGRPLRGADRPEAGPLLHLAGGPGPRGGAPVAPRGEDRSLRGLVRHLRRAGLRAPLPGAAPLAHARRRLPASGDRSGLGRPGRGDPDRARALLLPLGDLPDAGSGRAGHALRRPGARRADPRHGPRRRRKANRRPAGRGRPRAAGLRELLVPRSLARPAGRRPRVEPGRQRRDPASRRRDRGRRGPGRTILPAGPRGSTSRSSATTTRSSGIRRPPWPGGAQRPMPGSRRTLRARSFPSAPGRGPAPISRASSPASAGRRRLAPIPPTRPEPRIRTFRRSSSTATWTRLRPRPARARSPCAFPPPPSSEWPTRCT
jgi:hypothetical protein